MTRVSIDPGVPPGPGTAALPESAALPGPAALAEPAGAPATRPMPRIPLDEPGGGGLIERVMSTVIRKLAWSRLSQPRVAVTVSAIGLLLGMLVGAMAPNDETLPIRLPLSTILPSLSHQSVLALGMLYAGDILACLGLAGMLWAHSQGWRPDPRVLLLVSTLIVAVMVSLTPVGSSDTASYAAYGRIAAQGGDPYTISPLAWGDHAYTSAVGSVWKTQLSVYGPVATAVQAFAASIGGASVANTIWVLMILNGIAFVGVGFLLLKTSDDPLRATLFWTANPVLIQQLVSGGHLDTLVAAVSVCAIQVARRVRGPWGDVLTGAMIGIACGIKINAVLVGIGLAWALLRRHEWQRTARIAAVSLAVLVFQYSFYGLAALQPLSGGSKLVTLPSPWRFFQMSGQALGIEKMTMATWISVLWPVAMFIVAWLINQRISSDQPGEIVAPFALTFAWILVAPWVFAWYTAIAWAALALVPRNRMTRWLTIVTVVLALYLSNGGHGAIQ